MREWWFEGDLKLWLVIIWGCEWMNDYHMKVIVIIIWRCEWEKRWRRWSREAWLHSVQRRQPGKCLQGDFDQIWMKFWKLLETFPNELWKWSNQCHICQVTDPVHGEEGEIPLSEMRWFFVFWGQLVQTWTWCCTDSDNNYAHLLCHLLCHLLVHHMIIMVVILQELKCSGWRQTYDEVWGRRGKNVLFVKKQKTKKICA